MALKNSNNDYSLSLRQRLALEIHRSIRHNQARLHPLRNLFWECTLRCNLNCRHCGSDCKQSASLNDMPANVFFKAIDDITPHVDPHHTFITLTGGEALLRPDLDDVGKELYNRQFPWGIVSNGFLLSSQRLARLLDAGLHSISISLDSFAPFHNYIRGNPQSFARADAAIRTIAAVPDLVWDVVTCVYPGNYDSLSEFRDYLCSIGVRRWRLLSIFPMGRAAVNNELQLSPDQFRGLFEFIRNARQDNSIHVSYGCEGFLGSLEGQVRDYLFHCLAGIEVASILSDGSISGCTSIRSKFYQGNIYKDNLWDVWQNNFRPFRNRSWTKKDQCTSCKVFRYCEGSGMHLYDDNEQLLFCHYNRLQSR